MKRILSKAYINNFHMNKESGYKVVPSIDPELYPKRQGLEGPFRLHSGKVVYYDSREGKYYDASTDLYLSEEDYMTHNTERENPHNPPIKYPKR